MPNIRRKYYLCPHKQKCFGLSLASSWCERKVRAAQDIPLPKIEAIGDSRVVAEEKNRLPREVRVRRWCKRPPGSG